MLILGSGISIWLLLLGSAAALAFVFLAYRRVLGVADYGVWLPRTLLGLRVAAVLLCLAMIANPILRINIAPKDNQRIAVVVDASRSMAVKDSLGGETRLDSVRRVLSSQGVLSQLDSLAATQVWSFDTAARQTDLPNMAAVGEASDLAIALKTIREDKQKAPLCAIVVLTDGCETGTKSAAELPADIPIYTVGLGSLHEALVQFPDVSLAEVKADHEAFVHTQIEAKVELRETNLAGERVTVQIARGNQVLDEQSVELQKDTTRATLHFTPTEPGLYDLEARVLPHAKEKITENNGRFFSVRVSGQKIRVFYYEGTPRWTYKYMLRELKRDPQLALQALLRTNIDALYQSSSASSESGSGGGGGAGPIFPSTREALKGYDCVILGDVRGSDLTPAQVEALKQHISEDGGGLILLAGKESYSAAGLPMLGLDVMMPASLASVKELTGAFNLALTQEGTVHPAFGGLDKLLPVSSVYTLGEPKPGAQVLARAGGDKGSYPIALAQRYGNGRVFAFATDSDWNWPMKYKANDGDVLFGRFWGQVIRWSANRQLPPEQQAAVTLTTDKDLYKIGETVHVYASGSEIAQLKEASVAEPLPITIGPKPTTVPGAGKIAFAQSGDRLEAQFIAKQSGLHRITAGGATGEFLVERPAGEFDRLALNDALLRQLSAASGGQYFDATTARNLPETIKLSGKIKTEVKEYVFDDSWFPFALMVLALAAEWALRKRMQVI